MEDSRWEWEGVGTGEKWDMRQRWRLRRDGCRCDVRTGSESPVSATLTRFILKNVDR